MSRYWKDTTQAAGTVGLDIIANERYAKEPYSRLLRAVGYTGSAAIGDCDIEVLVGGQQRATLINSKLGMGSNNDDMKPVNLPIPGNIQLQVKITTQATTNPTCLELDFAP